MDRHAAGENPSRVYDGTRFVRLRLCLVVDADAFNDPYRMDTLWAFRSA